MAIGTFPIASFSRKLRDRPGTVKGGTGTLNVVVRSLKLILEFVIGAVVGIAILLSAAVWRLSGEPVSLAFLTPYFQQALSAEDGSFQVQLDDTVLTWAGWERTVDIRLRGVRAIGSAGETLAMVPEMAVSISARGLLHGIVAPTSLEIMGAGVRVVRSPSGDFELGLKEGGAAAGDIMERLVTDLLAPPHPDRAMGYLSRVSILDANLTLVDEKLETTWDAPRASLSLLRDDLGISGDLSLDLAMDGEFARFDAEVAYDTDAQEIDIGASFGNLKLEKLGGKAPVFAALKTIKMPLSGTLAATINLDGRVEVFGFDLSGGPGRVRLADLYEDELPVETVVARGRFEQDLTRMVLDELAVDVGGPTVGLSAEVVRVAGDLAVRGEAVVRDLPVDSFDRYWPRAIGTNVRKWTAKHLSGGEVREARSAFAALIRGGDLNQARLDYVAGTIDFAGVSFDYVPPMPMAEDLEGVASYTSERFDIDITGGVLGGLRVEEGSVTLSDLDLADQNAWIEVVARGALRDLLQVLDHEPLRAAHYLGIAPESAGGETAARAIFTLPVKKHVPLEEVDVSAAATLSDVGIPGAVLGRDLTEGELTLRLNRKGMEYQGTAKLRGIPVWLSGSESFTAEAGIRSRYALRARVDHDDLAGLGFATAPYLQGPVPVELIHTVMEGGESDLSVAADLKDATLDFRRLGWVKAPGVPGSTRFSISLVDERPTRLREFALAAGDLTATGSAVFAPSRPEVPEGESALERIDFTRLAFGRNDVAGRVVFRKDGGYDVDLAGPVLDGERFFAFKGKEEGEAEEAEPELAPVRLTAKVQRLWVTPENYISDVDCTITYDGETWRSLALQGRMEGATPEAGMVRMQLVPEGTVRNLSVTSGDAGLFLRTFGYLDNIQGGKFELTGTIDDSLPEQPVDGKVVIKNYRLIQAPVLAKLLTAASLTGILNLLSGEGIGFMKLEAPFRLVEGVAEVKDARAFGPDLGLTAKGKIDLASNTLDLEGTLVPAYVINSILGNIPLVGGLFTGEPGGGVFAVTYKMKGPRDDPKVTANPLTALAPGFMRKLFNIFERPKDEGPQQESAAKPPQGAPQWPNSPVPAE
jgi:hypothetical protein